MAIKSEIYVLCFNKIENKHIIYQYEDFLSKYFIQDNKRNDDELDVIDASYDFKFLQFTIKNLLANEIYQ